MINLIGKRLLDFIIVGGVVFGISYGTWAVGNNIVDRRRRAVDSWEEVDKICRNAFKPLINERGRMPLRAAEVYLKGALERGPLIAEAKHKLKEAEKWNCYFLVASLLFALLGVISTIGIVFMAKELSQRDAFVSTWRAIFKASTWKTVFNLEYMKGYFKSDKKDI